ncbi:MAG TPA: ABC transporter substrate-binding protein [Marmoricola sp.]|nr:ABC transporter substrate-binding protein [Marmoricola sp.]
MRRSMLAAGLLAASMAVAGCGSNSLSGGPAHKGGNVNVAVDKAAAAKVPADLKKKGTLAVGTDASYAPSEFLAANGSTIEGFDIDLFKAVAKKLGLKASFQNASFDTIITGVTGGKYDVGVSSFTINSDRMKQADMISYFNAGTQWAAQPGEVSKVDPQKPCGLKVAVQKGTTQLLDDLPSKIKACKAAGKPIDVLVYDKQDQATAAVVAGKAQAMLADSPVVAYAVQQSNGKLAAAGDIYDAAPYGYVIPKNDGQLGEAIVMALKDLDKSGDYSKILKDWGVQQGAIHDFAVNP